MGEFSKDEMNQMSDKLSVVASAITGSKVNGMLAPALRGGGGGGGVMNLLSCAPGSDCYKTKRDSGLKQKFVERINILDNAEIELSRAEKNYYVYNEGSLGGETIYKNIIIDRFATTAKEFKKNSIDRQQQFMSDLSQALKQYQAQVMFQSQSAKLLQLRQDEHANLIKNINYYQKILQTSERKAVYEYKNMDSLYMYRRMMIFVYYSAIICFIIFANFIPDKLYMNYTVWLLIVIAAIFPIILNLLIKWIFIGYDMVSYYLAELPHKDVYMSFGKPSNEKPPPLPLGLTSSANPLETSAIPASVSSAMSSLPGR